MSRRISPAPSSSKIVVRWKLTSRMYDIHSGARRKPKRIEDDYEEVRVTEEQIDLVNQNLAKRHPPKPKPDLSDVPVPFEPYYRKTREEQERDQNRPVVYKYTKPFSLRELASNPEAYKSWQDQLNEKMDLDRKWMGGKFGIKRSSSAENAEEGGGEKTKEFHYPKSVGSMYESAPGRFKKAEREIVKKELDPALNMQDHGFDLDLETGHYLLNGTRMPQKFDHWIEEPGTVKTSRDLRLLKKIERAKEKAAAAHRAKHMGLTAQRSDQALDRRHEVTRRMVRVSSMLLDEVQKAMEALPNYLAQIGLNISRSGNTFSKGKKGGSASLTRGQTLAESTVLTSGLVSFSRVEVSRDLLHAKVFWECPDHLAATAERELERATSAVRHLVTQAVQMKYSPEILFLRETTSQLQQEVGEILNQVEYAYKAYEASADSPYLPIEAPPIDTTKRINVNVAKVLPSRPVKTAFQQKLVRSRWTSKPDVKEEHLAEWKPPQ